MINSSPQKSNTGYYINIYLIAELLSKTFENKFPPFVLSAIKITSETYLCTAFVESFLLSNHKPTNLKELLFFELNKSFGITLFNYMKNIELDLQKSFSKFSFSFVAAAFKMKVYSEMSFVAKEIFSDSMYIAKKLLTKSIDKKELTDKAEAIIKSYIAYIFFHNSGLEHLIKLNFPDDKGMKYAVHNVTVNILNALPLILNLPESKTLLYLNELEFHNTKYNITPTCLTFSTKNIITCEDNYNLISNDLHEDIHMITNDFC